MDTWRGAFAMLIAAAPLNSLWPPADPELECSMSARLQADEGVVGSWIL